MEAKEITDIGTLTVSYDVVLVVLSIVIAIIGSYTAVDLAGQIPVAQEQARKLWLTGGTLALGITIWAAHFIATLAYQLPIGMACNFSIVFLSMAVAIVGSGAGLFVVSRQPLGRLTLLAAGVFIGLGISGMHFTAMTAMRLSATALYDLKLVVLSNVWAVGLSLSSLWLLFYPSAKTTVSESRRKIGSAILTATAIIGMHYIAMSAISFYPTYELAVVESLVMDTYPLATVIGAATLLLLIVASCAAFFGRRLNAETARAEVLRASEERYQSLYDFAPDAYFTIAADGTTKSVNQFGADYLGYHKEELIGQPFWRNIYQLDQEWFKQDVARIFNEKLVTSETELRQVRKDGSVLWVRKRCQLLFDKSGTPIELRLICIDITKRKQVEQHLLQNAFYDALTGLPNRALCMNRLGQVVAHAKRHNNYLFAVLFLDLNRFKVINDSLGHIIGDQLLIATARRLKICLRPTDMVARLGGDEFTILLENIRDVGDAIHVAERVQQQLTMPFNLEGQEVFTSASIGIALSMTGYARPAEVLRDADMAMYRAKSKGSARYEIFNVDMHTHAVARLQVETDLRNALKRQEFRLHYQPIVLLETGVFIGFEALLRWQHPQLGLQEPAFFLAVAQEIGLLTSICPWVLRVACSQLRQWQLQLPLISPLIISVNISGQRFIQANLVKEIQQILQETDLDASSLRLEISEAVIMKSAESATATLCQLRDLGVQLSIDDFGTGYSSLGRLHQFPINELKIDSSFVSHMSLDKGNLEIVSTILMLAHKLGIDVTAEGVETAEQLAQLKALKCKYGQGYFFSEPLEDV